MSEVQSTEQCTCGNCVYKDEHACETELSQEVLPTDRIIENLHFRFKCRTVNRFNDAHCHSHISAVPYHPVDAVSRNFRFMWFAASPEKQRNHALVYCALMNSNADL